MSLLVETTLCFISLLTVFNYVICATENAASGARAATFHFPEYAYKETSKNEVTYHDYELACSENLMCKNNANLVAKLNCLRRCISPSCYQDIYAFNELEEGEIDVRMNSFKGCVIQRI
ncbi:uncharacterized protein LOC108601759 [Drosophila busckii]|nr:uncharacterized protein LOC108601759 [Drosophila busckii]